MVSVSVNDGTQIWIQIDIQIIVLSSSEACSVVMRLTVVLSFQIERLAQYERLVGAGCGRRRAARLSDLERIQDLFPHDYLALHDADAPAALASHHAQV
jgi:hypothetical protein